MAGVPGVGQLGGAALALGHPAELLRDLLDQEARACGCHVESSSMTRRGRRRRPARDTEDQDVPLGAQVLRPERPGPARPPTVTGARRAGSTCRCDRGCAAGAGTRRGEPQLGARTVAGGAVVLETADQVVSRGGPPRPRPGPFEAGAEELAAIGVGGAARPARRVAARRLPGRADQVGGVLGGALHAQQAAVGSALGHAAAADPRGAARPGARCGPRGPSVGPGEHRGHRLLAVPPGARAPGSKRSTARTTAARGRRGGTARRTRQPNCAPGRPSSQLPTRGIRCAGVSCCSRCRRACESCRRSVCSVTRCSQPR